MSWGHCNKTEDQGPENHGTSFSHILGSEVRGRGVGGPCSRRSLQGRVLLTLPAPGWGWAQHLGACGPVPAGSASPLLSYLYLISILISFDKDNAARVRAPQSCTVSF